MKQFIGLMTFNLPNETDSNKRNEFNKLLSEKDLLCQFSPVKDIDTAFYIVGTASEISIAANKLEDSISKVAEKTKITEINLVYQLAESPVNTCIDTNKHSIIKRRHWDSKNWITYKLESLVQSN